MAKCSELPNIGDALEQQLHAVGILTAEELKALGSKEAWLRILKVDNSACMHRLTALEGAVRGVRKTLLPPEVREELKTFYQRNKA